MIKPKNKEEALICLEMMARYAFYTDESRKIVVDECMKILKEEKQNDNRRKVE